MSSLIITIISIGLAASISLAFFFFGGKQYSEGSAEAAAVSIIQKIEQIEGAAEFYYVRNVGQRPSSIDDLIDGNFLTADPVVLPEYAAIGVDSVSWTSSDQGQLMLQGISENVCLIINEKGADLLNCDMSINTVRSLRRMFAGSF